MAEGRRMTADVVAHVMAGEHGDFVRDAVALIARELMEAEVSVEVGAELGEVSPARVTHRTLIPKKRQGPADFPSFLEPRRRSEQAIVASVMEAYVNGVSTRKVDRLVEQLGIAGMTKDRGSALCRGLDEQVELFRQRPLEAPTRICGLTRSTSRSVTTAASSPRPWLSPMPCTSPVSGRSSAWISARSKRAASGSSSCAR